MNAYRRPWWLLVTKSTGLITTVQEESSSSERVFIIRGEPLIQGLAWLTWGPIGALLTVVILAALAAALQVNSQDWMVRTLFLVAFLGLPAMVWAGVVMVMARLSQKHLRAEREAEAEESIIRLDQRRGELSYQTNTQPHEERLAYRNIRQARTAYAIGERSGKALRLALDTDQGAIVLLSEALGTPAQKADLAKEIQQALNAYSNR